MLRVLVLLETAFWREYSSTRFMGTYILSFFTWFFWFWLSFLRSFWRLGLSQTFWRLLHLACIVLFCWTFFINVTTNIVVCLHTLVVVANLLKSWRHRSIVLISPWKRFILRLTVLSLTQRIQILFCEVLIDFRMSLGCTCILQVLFFLAHYCILSYRLKLADTAFLRLLVIQELIFWLMLLQALKVI